VVTGTQSGVTANVSQGAPAYTRDSTFTATVAVTSTRARPVSYIEVRLRLKSPTGRLLYQRTVFHNEATGTVDFAFARSLKDLDTTAREGRFQLEVRVFATSADTIDLKDRVLVFDPKRKQVPLVVVARLSGAPMTDPTGRFVIDPATDTASLDAAVGLNAAMARDPRLRFSVAAAPFMLEEWLRITDGYELVGAGGVSQVSKTSTTSTLYAAGLKSVTGLSGDRGVELLDVPYSEPDLPALARIGAENDLVEHYARSISTYRLTIEATPSAGTAGGDGLFPAASLPILVERGIRHVVVAPRSIWNRSGETTLTGAFRIKGSKVVALVSDPELSAHLATTTPDVAAIYDELFSNREETRTPRPVVATVALGPGSGTDADALTTLLGTLARSGWIRLATAQEAAAVPTTATVDLVSAIPERPAPPGYWEDVAKARAATAAYVSAAGSADADVRQAQTQVLIAESRTWAGPTGDWSLADRGRAFAQAAIRAADQVLGLVAVQASDVTLSGNSGKVPVTITNRSDKDLRVTVTADSGQLTFPRGASQVTILRPGEGYITIPVDLGQAIAGRMTVRVMAGDRELARSSLNVKASFLDRLAIVAAIVVGLVGLLVYVRSRMKRQEGSRRAGSAPASPPPGGPDGSEDE
jgi:hypothetical protein